MMGASVGLASSSCQARVGEGGARYLRTGTCAEIVVGPSLHDLLRCYMMLYCSDG